MAVPGQVFGVFGAAELPQQQVRGGRVIVAAIGEASERNDLFGSVTVDWNDRQEGKC